MAAGHRRYWAQLRNAEARRRPELLFEFDAAGDRAFDEDPDQALVPCPRNKAVRLGALHAEQFRHLALRLAAGEMQPSGARRQCGFLVQLQCRANGGSTLPISFEIFFLR